LKVRINLTNLNLALHDLLMERSPITVGKDLDFLECMAKNPHWNDMSLTDRAGMNCLKGIAYFAIWNYAEARRYFMEVAEQNTEATEAIVGVWRMWSESTATLSLAQKQSVQHFTLTQFWEAIPTWSTSQHITCTSILERVDEERYILEQLDYLGNMLIDKIEQKPGWSRCEKGALERPFDKATTDKDILEYKVQIHTGHEVEIGPQLVVQDRSPPQTAYRATIGFDKFVSRRYIIDAPGVLIPDEGDNELAS